VFRSNVKSVRQDCKIVQITRMVSTNFRPSEQLRLSWGSSECRRTCTPPSNRMDQQRYRDSL